MKCIKMLTFLSLDEIADMETWADNRINEKKEILAYELTKLVHGEEEAEKAREASKALFGGGMDSANMPTTTLADEDFTDGKIDILEVLVKTGITKSRGEGRRLVQQGGVSIDGNKIGDVNYVVEKSIFNDGKIVIKKGKKVFLKVTM
jgi:tyrosyl-tRNA synthetase